MADPCVPGGAEHRNAGERCAILFPARAPSRACWHPYPAVVSHERHAGTYSRRLLAATPGHSFLLELEPYPGGVCGLRCGLSDYADALLRKDRLSPAR